MAARYWLLTAAGIEEVFQPLLDDNDLSVWVSCRSRQHSELDLLTRLEDSENRNACVFACNSNMVLVGMSNIAAVFTALRVGCAIAGRSTMISSGLALGYGISTSRRPLSSKLVAMLDEVQQAPSMR